MHTSLASGARISSDSNRLLFAGTLVVVVVVIVVVGSHISLDCDSKHFLDSLSLPHLNVGQMNFIAFEIDKDGQREREREREREERQKYEKCLDVGFMVIVFKSLCKGRRFKARPCY